MVSKYRNSCQTCVCANRIDVQKGVLVAFTGKLVAKVRSLKVGNGVEPDVTPGPLIDDFWMTVRPTYPAKLRTNA